MANAPFRARDTSQASKTWLRQARPWQTLLRYAGLLALSVGIGVVWWRLWMYRGLAGPPPFLRALLSSDGERSYVYAEYEMILVAFAALVALDALVRFLVRRAPARPGAGPRGA